MRHILAIDNLSTGKQCLVIPILDTSVMEILLKKGDLKGDFSNPWEIPHMVKGLIPMTPGACQQVVLHRIFY